MSQCINTVINSEQWEEDLDPGFQQLYPRSHEECQRVTHRMQHEAPDLLRYSHVDGLLPTDQQITGT